MHLGRTLVLSFGLVVGSVGAAGATTFVVDPGGGGDFTTIQAALDAATAGDVVEVVPGVYLETLVMASGVVLRSQAGPEVTIVDGQGSAAVSLIHCEYCEPGTAVEGFSLTRGAAEYAAGILIWQWSHVVVRDCVLKDNHAGYDGGAGLVQRYSYGEFDGCRFVGNSSNGDGGVSVIVESYAVFQGCEFEANTGALSSCIGVLHSGAQILDTVFFANTAGFGATVHTDQTLGGVYLANCTFALNTCDESTGGAALNVYSHGLMEVDRCLFALNTGRPAIVGDGTADIRLTCNGFWDNDGHVAGLPDPIGTDGNFAADPLFCEPLDVAVALASVSPCLIGPCAPVGANPVPACEGPVRTAATSWSEVKARYR